MSNIDHQLAKVADFKNSLAPQPHFLWDGGCNGGKGFEVSGSPNFDECNAACNKHSWCDKFVYDGAAKNCWVNDVQCS